MVKKMDQSFRIRNSAKTVRREARTSLRSHWGRALGVTLLAAIFGAFSGAVYGFESILTQKIEPDLERINGFLRKVLTLIHDFLIDLGLPTDMETSPALNIYQIQEILEIILVVALCVASLSLLWFIIGGCIRVSLCRFRLALLDGEPARTSLLFSGFGEVFGRALAVRILRAIRVFLWGLLLVVPGIIAAYRYSMAEYVLAEMPGISARGALRESARMMRGNKARLFRLQLSFIGWFFLSFLSLGIGFLWVVPYLGQAECTFYHETSGRASIRNAIEEMQPLVDQL